MSGRRTSAANRAEPSTLEGRSIRGTERPESPPAPGARNGTDLGGRKAGRLARDFGEANAVVTVEDEAVLRVAGVPTPRPSALPAALQRSARAVAPASRKRPSKPRSEVDPPVTISASRVANSRAAQPPTPWRKPGSAPSDASSASSVLA